MDNIQSKTSPKTILWDKQSSSVSRTLRQPNIPSRNASQSSSKTGSEVDFDTICDGIHDLHCSQGKNVSIQEIAAKSNLKATAAEWYPSSSTTNFSTPMFVEPHRNSSSSVQNRLKISKRPSENEIVHSSAEATSLQNENMDDHSPDLRRMKNIISTLTRDPGQFRNLLEIFSETLTPYLDDITSISVITQTLVDQAIAHPNFRYTGAKLCWFIEQASPGFRAELHMRCKKKIEDEDTSDIQNVSLFIAELYTQLPHQNIYGVLLVASLQKLFEAGGNDNIKCICQALKLTGYSLEQSNRQDLDGILMKLEEVKGSVSETALILLNSVLALRLENWGHTNSETQSESSEDNFEYYVDDHPDTVYYNTEGEVLSKEENDFIAIHMNCMEEISSDYSDPDDLCDPEPEMDEEIQAAFKEFVKLSSKH